MLDHLPASEEACQEEIEECGKAVAKQVVKWFSHHKTGLLWATTTHLLQESHDQAYVELRSREDKMKKSSLEAIKGFVDTLQEKPELVQRVVRPPAGLEPEVILKLPDPKKREELFGKLNQLAMFWLKPFLTPSVKVADPI